MVHFDLGPLIDISDDCMSFSNCSEGDNFVGQENSIIDQQCSLGGVCGVAGNRSEAVRRSDLELSNALRLNDAEPQCKGTNLWNMAEAAVGSARTVEQQDELMNFLRSSKDKCIAENRSDKASVGTTFLGQDTSGPNVSKRKKMANEGWNRP